MDWPRSTNDECDHPPAPVKVCSGLRGAQGPVSTGIKSNMAATTFLETTDCFPKGDSQVR